MTTYAITGASGQLGRLTADLLLATVDPKDVVLTTRHPEALADLAARGADVRSADFDDPAGLAAAFAGVDRLLLISADTVGHRLTGQLAAIRAAVDAGVQHVLYTSITRPTEDNPAAVVPDHAATEAALAASGIGWTALRNALYADMQTQTVQQAAASGQLVTNAGDAGSAYVTRADCAAVAVAALVHDGELAQSYDVTGPEAVTAHDLAALATEISGHPVTVVSLEDAAYVQGLESAGLPGAVAELLASFGTATRQGFFDQPSDVVATFTGRAPTSVREVVLGS